MEVTSHDASRVDAGREYAVMFVFPRSLAPVLTGLVVLLTGAAMTQPIDSSGPRISNDDEAEIAAIDTRYQAAVERNDAITMAAILHPRFMLVLGDGRRFMRDDLLRSARAREVTYERQVEEAGTQAVQVHGDTAIVTARLWSRGSGPRGPFEHRLWFSDTYVRTPDGWRYLFGQASLPMPLSGDALSTSTGISTTSTIGRTP